MKKIKISNNKYALVDDHNYEWLNSFKWSYGDRGYAVRGNYANGNKRMRMHREIMKPKDHEVVVFLDGNRLNCTESNMAIRTHSRTKWVSPILLICNNCKKSFLRRRCVHEHFKRGGCKRTFCGVECAKAHRKRRALAGINFMRPREVIGCLTK